MPSLVKRPNSKNPNRQVWRGSKMVSGKRIYKFFPDDTEESKIAAFIWEKEAEKELKNGNAHPVEPGLIPNNEPVRNVETSSVTLGYWANEYLDFCLASYSKKVYQEKQSVFRRFFKSIDHTLPASSLTRSMVMSFILAQKTARSGYAANKDRKNLVAGWNWGMKYLDPLLPGPNPCLVEKMAEIKSPRYIPPEEDFWKVYDSAEGQDKVMLCAFLNLAARRGEIFRLTWPDVDFGQNRIRLWTRKRTHGSLESEWLPMTSELREMLMEWRNVRPIKDNEHVFLIIDPANMEYYGQPFKIRRRFMKQICSQVGVKPFGFHAIRHLTASILYRKGKNVSEIQAILRHKNPSTTNRYLQTLGLEHTRNALEDGLRR